MQRFKIIILALSFLLSGCAQFQGNQVNERSIPVNSNGELTRVTYKIAGNVEGKDEEFLKAVMHQHGIYLEWGVKRTDGTPHIDINLSFRRNGAATVAAVFTGASFYIIPSWQTQYYELQGHLTGPDLDYSYRVKDHTTLVQWLPMIIAFPFASPFTAESKLVMKAYTDMAYHVNYQLKTNSL